MKITQPLLINWNTHPLFSDKGVWMYRRIGKSTWYTFHNEDHLNNTLGDAAFEIYFFARQEN